MKHRIEGEHEDGRPFSVVFCSRHMPKSGPDLPGAATGVVEANVPCCWCDLEDYAARVARRRLRRVRP